jgi:hypothetical protein
MQQNYAHISFSNFQPNWKTDMESTNRSSLKSACEISLSLCQLSRKLETTQFPTLISHTKLLHITKKYTKNYIYDLQKSMVFHCAELRSPCNCSMVLHGDLLCAVPPKSLTKYGKQGCKLIYALNYVCQRAVFDKTVIYICKELVHSISQHKSLISGLRCTNVVTT